MQKNKRKEFQLEAFYTTYTKMYPQNAPLTENFLIWFIGFVEGDGGFFIHSARNQMVFSITQKDKTVLDEIQNRFGFGVIQPYCGPQKNCFNYTVYQYKAVVCLLALFNGNIVLNKVSNRFKRWLAFYNNTDIFVSFEKKSLLFDPRKPVVNLNHAWLAGFTQAEGGFYLGLEKRYDRNSENVFSNYRFVKKYHVSQKNELSTLKHIRNVIYEKIQNKKQTLDLTSMKYILTDKRKKTQQLQLTNISFLLVLLLYFDKYPLYGKKKRQYHQWKRCVKSNLLKSCDSELKIEKLKRLIQRSRMI